MINITLEEIKSQIPEHIREQYPSFAEFVYSYYKFLDEQYPADLLSIRDIDQTSDEFLASIKNELANKFGDVSVEERILLKNIKQYYSSKGSEDSVTFLFNAIFSEKVLIEYPSQKILKLSDGAWTQETSFFVEVISDRESPYDYLGQEIIVNNDQGNEIYIELQKIQKTNDPNVLEFFVDRGFFGNIQPGNNVYVGLFVGKLLSTTTDLKITQGGKGFFAGQTYDLNIGGSSGSRLKIDRVDLDGSVKKASIINFGYGYDIDFSVSLVPNSGKTGSQYANLGGDIQISGDEIDNPDSGYINEADYVQEEGDGSVGFDPTYVGAVLSRFTAPLGNTDQNIPLEEHCVVSIKTSPLTKYPGYWKDNKGMPSDAMYIFDGKYYQNFSYVVKTIRRLEEYQSLLKALAHPAGYKMFAINDIRSDYDTSAKVTSILQGLLRRFMESVQGVSGEQIKDVGKNIETPNLIEEQHYLDFVKDDFLDSVSPSIDERYNDFGKGEIDNFSTQDSNIKGFGKLNTDTINASELIEFHLERDIFDNQSLDSLINIQASKALSINAEISDSGSIQKTSNYFSEGYGNLSYAEGERLGIISSF